MGGSVGRDSCGLGDRVRVAFLGPRGPIVWERVQCRAFFGCLWKVSFVKSAFSDGVAHHGWEIGFVRMGREHSAYETDVAGFEPIATGTFDGSECLVMVRVRVTDLAAACVIGVDAGTGLS